MPAASAWLTGFVLGGGLLAGLRRQTLFMLQKGRHAGTIAAAALVSDAILFMAGSWLLRGLVRQSAWLPRFAAALLATAYALSLLRRLVARYYSLPRLSPADPPTRKAALRRMLQAIWLDPLGWLHLFVLPGLLMAGQHDAVRTQFLTGLVLASIAWRVTLVYGAWRLRPLFSRSPLWRLLDALAGLALLWAAGQTWFFALSAAPF